MNSPNDKDRPEAGRYTESGKRGEGANARDADSGGSRTKAGGTYGDWVPDRGQPMKNNDRDADAPPMGDYYTGGGNIDRLAQEPGSSARSDETAGQQAASGESGGKARDDSSAPGDEQSDEERVAEANRNKSFDTTHVHTATTSRKV